MITWLKKMLLREGILELNALKPFIANKIIDAQAKLNSVPPQEFADTLVTEIQVTICNKVGIVPAEIGIKEK